NQPRAESESVGAVSGKRYTTTTGVASYTFWSLTNANYRSDQDNDPYLDATAELLWEGLLKSAREQLDDQARRLASMTYVRDLLMETLTPSTAANAGLPGREYTLTVGDMTGTTKFFVARDHLYLMLVVGRPGEDWPRERFFASFRTSSSSTAPSTKPSANGSYGSGTRASEVEDPDSIFSGKEVTAKARVLEKPEPAYTEGARKFGIQGKSFSVAYFPKMAR